MKHLKLFENWDQDSHDRLVRMGLTKSLNDWVHQLLNDRSAYVPPHILAHLASLNRYNMLVARHPETPIEILAHLSTDEDYEVRSAVAMNDSTPVEVLRRLAKDKIEQVRFGVAINSRVPSEILSDLREDDSIVVRSAADNNPNW